MTHPREEVRAGLQTDRPHSARVWNYLLGGKDNHPVDSEAGEVILKTFPEFAAVAQLQRRFLARAVRFLTDTAGVRQFLDIGTGLPTADSTHQLAQRIAPESRIVYVDNDPLVLVHAQALLTSSTEGACAYVDADVRAPERVLAEAAKTLDLSRPVALTMLGIMGQISDAERPAGLRKTCLKRKGPAQPDASATRATGSAVLRSSRAACRRLASRRPGIGVVPVCPANRWGEAGRWGRCGACHRPGSCPCHWASADLKSQIIRIRPGRRASF